MSDDEMSDDTLTSSNLGRPRIGDSEPSPIRELGRLRLGRMLGQGGMGQVYEARDPHLRRTVAVKLLLHATAADQHRFVREAQAQAAQTHPDICPVYEAGEQDGVLYIVMKRIEGLQLDQATVGWTLESKLGLFCRIADAVHAAHRTGLVHRDLKPSNLMVETGEDGEPRPFILDFGLARDVGSGGVAGAGEALGTPGFMAPEQLSGEGRTLDRRTDVYALGVTLYLLLAGDPPFPGTGSATLRAVAEQDPLPLRPLGVPEDVEAVVFKCLEKAPEHRYRSARALAEDLRRFLDDVPVEARPHSRWFRLRKWARRNQAPLRLGAVFAVLLLAALTWGGVTAWTARERERLARSFTEQVEEIEALARYSHMAPLHDIRSDRELIRRRMDDLRQEMVDSRARAAGHYALGRGFLALEAPEDAYRELETAWQGGYRQPEVAAALALTLSALYRDGLAAAELRGDWESRQQRLRQLDERYGSPARDFLAQSLGEGTLDRASQPYLAALGAFHGGRLEAALDLLDDSENRRSWSYEFDALEGDVRRSLAIRLHAENQPETARVELERALVAYDRAARIAPSDPAVARAASQVAVLYGIWEMLSGEDLVPIFDRGLNSVQQALDADPNDGRAWLWQARLQRLGAQSLRVRSEDPSAGLAGAQQAARRAAELLPEPDEAYLELGKIVWGKAQWQRERGEDPADAVNTTIAAFDRVAPAWRDHRYYLSLGLAHMTLADYQGERGEEAASSMERAATAYRAAIELHSAPFAALSNLGTCLLKKSQLPSTVDRLSVLREAVAVFQEARSLDPDHVAPHYYLGRCYLRLAQGGNPASGLLDDHVHKALESSLRALGLNPRMALLHNTVGEIHHLQAVHAWEQGRDPEPSFALARDAYAAGLAAAPRHAWFYQNLAWTAYFQGKVRVRADRDPGPYLDEALRHARQALELSEHPGAILCIASAYRLRAERAVRQGGAVVRSLEEAEEALQRVLKLNPRHAEAHRSLGRLYTLEARWLAATGDDPGAAFERAFQTLEQALVLEPTVAYFHLAMARWALERNRLEPSIELRDLGLRRVDEALRLRPGWPEATTLRAALIAGQFLQGSSMRMSATWVPPDSSG